MFYLHIANRTEHLVQQLAAVLHSDKQPPFAKELFLVQSRGMERLICRGLADALGIFCNYRFFFPLEFLQYVAEKIGSGTASDGFDRETVGWRLEVLLRDIAAPVYRPLAAYLHGDGTADAAKRRFQLACRLADCFDQYQIMRPEMIVGWQQGKTFADTPGEAWQAALWQRLLAGEDAGPGGLTENGESLHRTGLLVKSIKMLSEAKEGAFAGILPHRISVFGVHTLPPIFLQYLNAFARHGNVHFYLLSPCREYWGDIKDSKTHIKTLLKKPAAHAVTQSADSADPLLAEESVRHPLLGFLGKQGRDLHNMMADMDIYLEIPSYFDPAEEAAKQGRTPTILERVQSDLLAGEIRSGNRPAEPDDSLRIVSCCSVLRELEVLHEYLLDLFEQDSTLNPGEIVVMAPDIGQYAPFVPAVFRDIPHAIADRTLRQHQPAVAAFASFLALFSGNFGRGEVLELLQYQDVAASFSLNAEDVENLLRWTEDAGIRRGLSPEQHEAGAETPAALSFASFRAGLDRLLMGYAAGCDDFIGDIVAFPEVEGSGGRALGGLCLLVEFLQETTAAFRRPRPLTAWRKLLLSCIDRLFSGSVSGSVSGNGSADTTELRRLIFSLGESGRFTGEYDIEFSVIETWFTAATSSSGSDAAFLRGELTFCSMLPMRSIPFRAVCLLGINDGEFPQSNRNYTFNLLSGSPRPGDRSPRNDDLYQFLEAILAARNTLYISYIGRSEKSGETLPPSVVVSELLEVLTKWYAPAIAPVCHPLYPFDIRYFDRSGTLFSYSEENVEIARLRQEGGKQERDEAAAFFPWWRGENEKRAEGVSFAELCAFYTDPPTYFIKNILGISLEKEQAAKEDSEPFSPDSLERYQVDDRLLTKMSRQPDWDNKKFLRYFNRLGRWPLGLPGEFSFAGHFTAMEDMVRQAAALELGEKAEDLFVDIASGNDTAGLHLFGRLSGRYERGNLLRFPTKIKGKHLLSAWLFHLLDNFRREETAPALRPTRLLTTTDCGCFSTLPGEGEPDVPNLLRLLQLWQQGCTRPLPLYTEPAFAWAKAAGKGERAALQKAIAEAEKRLAYTPEWRLLLDGKEICESVKSEEFYRYAKEIMLPLYTLFTRKEG